MKTKHSIIATFGALIAFSLTSLFAQEALPSATPETPAAPEKSVAVEAPAAPADEQKTITVTAETTTVDVTTSGTATSKAKTVRVRVGSRGGDEIVTIGSDAHVPAGKTARSAVAVFGDVIVDGTTDQAVAVLGSVTTNTQVRGAVSIAGSTTINAGARGAVAVAGNVYVNSHVTRGVVAVGGGVELGPDARIDGDVVTVGGPLKRHPSATIGGKINEVKVFGDMDGLQAWFSKALVRGRLLAFGEHLGWAWMVAGIFLACYLLATLIFPKAVTASAVALETKPGATFLTALGTMILLPILCLLLVATGLGIIIAVPLKLAIALIGKAAFMAWLGRRITLPLGSAHPVLAVLVGGVLLALCYCLPVFGIIVWKLSGFLGAGMAVYAAIIALRARSAARAAALAAKKAEQQAAIPPLATPVENALITPEAAAALEVTRAPRAGFWIRLGALLIDFIMIAIVAKMCHLGLILLPLFAAYCIVLWTLRGTTIGGIVCGLKIVRLDGRPVDWATAIVRALGGFVSMFPVGLGFIWVGFDDEKQSWHDKIAGTVVVHAPKGQSLV